MSGYKGHHEVQVGTERSFGVVFAIVFTIIGLWPLPGGGDPRYWSLLLAALFLVSGLFFPGILRPLNILWFKLGMLLGRIVAPLVIALLFFVAVTPTGLIMRALRKDILRLKLDRNASSYWISRSKKENPMGSMKNQF